MKAVPFIIADVFTDRRFGGNQLAVFTDARGLAPDTMQDIAREMNYSETTFLLPPEQGGDFRVRIFTPARELPFAGHPIVGTAYVIVSERLKQSSEPATAVSLETGVGLIRVEIGTKDGRPGRTTMTQPLPRVTTTASRKVVESLADALGLKSSDILGAELPVQAIFNGITVLIVPAKSIAAVKSIKPESGRLAQIADEMGAETVLVFTGETEHPASTVHCRVFAPAAGVGEDAATGSANGPLGYYLVQHKLVRVEPVTRIISEQGYEMKRPSTLFIDLDVKDGTGEVTGVRVGGDVVIAGRGDIVLD